MIPIEILWITLIAIFAIIGLARGLWKELGVTTIVLLSLFTLNFGQKLIVERMEEALPSELTTSTPAGTVAAIYYGVTITFAAFIAYQGISLEFPVKKHTGPLKWLFGFLGGLLNGYLIVGTIWDVCSEANYFGLGDINNNLTALHTKITPFLPISLMNEHEPVSFIFLAAGMILLLAIVLK